MASTAELAILLTAKDQASKTVQGFGKSLGDVGKIATGILAAGGITQVGQQILGFASDSVKAATDLGESINAVNVVFGRSADTILDWGQTSAEQAGLSERAFNQLATPLGAMLRNAGFSMDQVAGKTIELTQRAADMASVFNTSVEDALTSVQAALRGETDPIEKYGVALNAAKVEMEALAMTGKKTTKELTDQEKAAARLSLIMKQTSRVQGDFANTSDSLANKSRIANARMEEMQAEIGERLLPVMLEWKRVQLEVVGFIVDDFIPGIDNLIRRISSLRDILSGDIDIPIFDKIADFFSDFGLPSLPDTGMFADIARALGLGRIVGQMGAGHGTRDSGEGRLIYGPPSDLAGPLKEAVQGLSDDMEEASVNTKDLGDELKEATHVVLTFHDVLDHLSQMVNDVFGRPTREEAELGRQIAEVDRAILLISGGVRQIGGDVDSATAPWENLRDNLINQLDVMESENRLQQIGLQLADTTLLTEAEQNNAVQELIPLIRDQSFWVREQVGSYRELIPAMRTFIAQLHDFAEGVGWGSPAFNSAVSPLQLAERGVL